MTHLTDIPRASPCRPLTFGPGATVHALTAPDRAKRKARAFTDAFFRHFRITGDSDEIFQLRTVRAVLVDEMQAAGFPDTDALYIDQALRQLHADPRVKVTLRWHDVPGRGEVAYVHGITAWGAPT
ncbi:hypothetical protein HKCCE4037_06575 [Rhodobacterales bacterium HKCCE4037]|nr:hypothetical protein [Rhodobacterales bacterium HKCCE4037]